MGEMIDLVASDTGAMRGYRALPGGGHGPAVIVLQEIFGVNVAMRSVADALAAEGYVAIVPDLFWRLRPGVDLGYAVEEVQQAFALWQQFDFAQGTEDTLAAVAAARAMRETTGGVALLGFCMGGQLAVRAGAAGDAAAVVCFYGTKLGEHLGEIAALDAPTAFHFGDQDQHVPSEVQASITGIAAGKPQMTVDVYASAGHGFFNAFRPAGFDQAAHDAAWASTLALIGRAMARTTA